MHILHVAKATQMGHDLVQHCKDSVDELAIDLHIHFPQVTEI
jgi:hypothetical protein